MSKRVAKVGTGSKDRHWVYGIIREMIEEDKYARFVDNGERYIIDWNEAIKRYWDFKSKKNPELKSKTFDRRKESNNLRTALLEHYKNEGAKEYIESIKKNDEGKIVERQFQMPLRIYKLLFENNAEMFHDKSAVDSPLEGTCSGGRYGDTSNEVDFLRGVVQEIQPLSGLVKGGYQFVISLKEQLPDDVTTGIVQFDGVAQVKAQRLNPYTLFGIVPPSHQPRDIVPVIVFTGAGQRLGITCFSYSDEMREMDSARDLNADLQEESEPIDTTMNESSFLNSGRNDQIVMNPVPNQRPAVSTGTENGTSSTGGERMVQNPAIYAESSGMEDIARDLNADLQEESEPIDTTMNESSFLNRGRNDQIVMNPVPNQRPAFSTGTENGTSSTGGERMVQNPAIYAESSGMEDIARDLNADLQEESEPIDTTMNESSFLNSGRNEQIVMNPVPNQIPAVSTGTENGTLSTGGERMVQNPAIYAESSGMEDIARDLNADLQEESEPIDTTMNESSFLNRGRNDQIVMNPVPNQIPAVITGTENGTLSTGGERMVQNPAIYPKSSGMEGGEEFHITFPEPLAQEVTSGVALFKGVGYAPLTKYSQCDLIGIVPPSTKPGIFDVGVLDQTGDYLGTTKFSYTSPALLEKVQQVLRDGNLDTLYVYFMLTQKFGSLQVSVGDNNAAQGSDPLNMQDQG